MSSESTIETVDEDKATPTRPKLMTLLSWLVIASSLYSLVWTYFDHNDPKMMALLSRSTVPFPLLYLQSFLWSGFGLISGVALLNGQNWGRWLQLILRISGFAFVVAAIPMSDETIEKLIVSIIDVIILAFLFTPNARAYLGPFWFGRGYKSLPRRP